MKTRTTLFTPSKYTTMSKQTSVQQNKGYPDVPAKHARDSPTSDWRRFIDEERDPEGFSVKCIDKKIGKGVFSNQKWHAGSFLFEYAGELVSREEGLKREHDYPLKLGSFLFFFKTGRKQLCIDATFSDRIGRFVNDGIGEERNSETRVIYVDKTPHIGIFSIRNISPGDEIRYDYAAPNLPWRIKKEYPRKSNREEYPRKSSITNFVGNPVVVLCDVRNTDCPIQDRPHSLAGKDSIANDVTSAQIATAVDESHTASLNRLNCDDATFTKAIGLKRKTQCGFSGKDTITGKGTLFDSKRSQDIESNNAKDKRDELNFTLVQEECNDDIVVIRVHLESTTEEGKADGQEDNDIQRGFEYVEAVDDQPIDSNSMKDDLSQVRAGSKERSIQQTVTDSTVQTRDAQPINLQSNCEKTNITKKKKPHRPCPFCGEFKSKLSEHLQLKHKHEPEVVKAVSLPPSERNTALAKLRKRGIYNANIKLIKENGDSLIRERSQGSDKLVTCLSCKAFLSKTQFHKHRKLCKESTFEEPPRCMDSSFLTDITDNETYRLFQSEVLDKFLNDDEGKECRKDPYIRAFGYRKYLSVANRKRKRDEKRKYLMSDMRNIAKLYLTYKTCGDNAKKECGSISIVDMFNRKNITYLKEAIRSRKSATPNRNNLADGYTLKRFGKFLHDFMLSEGKDECADEIHKFLSSFSNQWIELFGESECEVLISRTETRMPQHLPNENEIKMLKSFITAKLENITSDEYNFIAESEYTLLRDLLVCRLTLFNARRGGEPSRLTIDEWKDAVNDVWLDRSVSSTSSDDNNFKVAYQAGKHDGKLVPVLFPPDCLSGLKLLADPDIRKDAKVHSRNKYIFPRTKLSEYHVVGTDSIDSICKKAGVQNITATKFRHRAATIYASLDVCDVERRAFLRHMGHSESINLNVYQCPPALLEVTKVGSFLKRLDEGDRQAIQNPSISNQQLRAVGTDQVIHDEDQATEVRDSQANREDGNATTTDTTQNKRDRQAIQNPCISNQQLRAVGTDQVIHDEDQATEVRNSQANREDGNATTTDTTQNKRDRQAIQNPCISNQQLRAVGTDQVIHDEDQATEVRDSQANSEDGNDTTTDTTQNKQREIDGRYRWSEEETKILNSYFSRCIYDVSRSDRKGSLPGYTEIRRFLKIHPGILAGWPTPQRISKIHTRLYNERNKSREIAQKRIIHSS